MRNLGCAFAPVPYTGGFTICLLPHKWGRLDSNQQIACEVCLEALIFSIHEQRTKERWERPSDRAEFVANGGIRTPYILVISGMLYQVSYVCL